MRCDDCACYIPDGEEIVTTRSERVGGAGPLGANTRTETVIICAGCERRRGLWGWLAGSVVALLILGGIAFILFEIFWG